LCQLPDYVVRDELAQGTLVELLPELRPPPMPISAVMPTGRLVPQRVRVLLQALDRLRERARP
ncbi:MAG: LysR family transcriptional regulator, partial [Rhodocyclaceae bacterium]|nr:LysR family transcriptional regulator [Rhodocyclaceae bacterium]